MIFEIFLGFFAVVLILLIIGLTFNQWFFVLGSAIVLFILTALLWSASSVDTHTGNTVTTTYGNNGNGTIINSSETVTFNFQEIQGFNKDLFALFTLLSSLAIFFMSLESRKEVN